MVPFDGLAAELTTVSSPSVAGNKIAMAIRTFVRVTDRKALAIEVEGKLTKPLLRRSLSIFFS